MPSRVRPGRVERPRLGLQPSALPTELWTLGRQGRREIPARPDEASTLSTAPATGFEPVALRLTAGRTTNRAIRESLGNDAVAADLHRKAFTSAKPLN